ncbi:MAG TPA: hypothetical protein VF384_09480 [Planctomycetota bacterium]
MTRTTQFLLASVLLGHVALAQAPAAAAQKVVSGELGFDFTSQYFVRGIVQENQGIIAQPWFELSYGLYEGTDDLRNLRLVFGQWNSLHDGPTGSGGTGQSMWYESDFFFGLAGAIGDRLSVGATYTAYYGPNGARGTVEELALSAGYDDKGKSLIDSIESGLQPGVVLAFELDGQMDNGEPGNNGVYLQAGIRPSFVFGQFTLDVPVTMGFSLMDYYENPGSSEDDFLGFLDVGAVMSTTIPSLPARMGQWQAHAGIHWLLLGDNNEDRNVGDTTELIFSCGVSTIF